MTLGWYERILMLFGSFEGMRVILCWYNVCLKFVKIF